MTLNQKQILSDESCARKGCSMTQNASEMDVLRRKTRQEIMLDDRKNWLEKVPLFLSH